MAERHRSKDGKRETEKFVNEAETRGQQGRAGGTTQTKVGTRDEQKNVDGEATTRVTGTDDRENKVVENR